MICTAVTFFFGGLPQLVPLADEHVSDSAERGIAVLDQNYLIFVLAVVAITAMVLKVKPSLFGKLLDTINRVIDRIP